MNETYCVHIFQWYEEKTESLAIRTEPLLNPFPDRRSRWWQYNEMYVNDHKVFYSYHDHQAWGDYQVAQSIIGIAMAHKVHEPNSKDFCHYVKKTWDQSRNFIDFMFSLAIGETDREKVFGELVTHYTGVLDIDKVSFLKIGKMRKLKASPDKKVVDHFLFTTEPPWKGRSNSDIFGIRTKFEGVCLI